MDRQFTFDPTEWHKPKDALASIEPVITSTSREFKELWVIAKASDLMFGHDTEVRLHQGVFPDAFIKISDDDILEFEITQAFEEGQTLSFVPTDEEMHTKSKERLEFLREDLFVEAIEKAIDRKDSRNYSYAVHLLIYDVDIPVYGKAEEILSRNKDVFLERERSNFKSISILTSSGRECVRIYPDFQDYRLEE